MKICIYERKITCLDSQQNTRNAPPKSRNRVIGDNMQNYWIFISLVPFQSTIDSIDFYIPIYKKTFTIEFTHFSAM